METPEPSLRISTPKIFMVVAAPCSLVPQRVMSPFPQNGETTLVSASKQGTGNGASLACKEWVLNRSALTASERIAVGLLPGSRC